MRVKGSARREQRRKLAYGLCRAAACILQGRRAVQNRSAAGHRMLQREDGGAKNWISSWVHDGLYPTEFSGAKVVVFRLTAKKLVSYLHGDAKKNPPNYPVIWPFAFAKIKRNSLIIRYLYIKFAVIFLSSIKESSVK